MSDTATPATGTAASGSEAGKIASPQTATQASDATVDLMTWYRRASQTDRRGELLAAFAHVETKAGRMRDTAANYRMRLAAFASSPA
jgi:hypothetical protein